MRVDVQVASECVDLPDAELIEQWVDLATQQRSEAEVVVRLVDEAESATLNETYRQKTGATNVLSFPFDVPHGLPEGALMDDILGDLVICAPVVIKEADQQDKPVLSHWAHMVVHGCLHLQGYDHINNADANVMEGLEVKLLESININNPYES
ncbi:MAG: rRNA maturation RNase YbeY [Cycloclasticus sp. symbiont of Bathymodiolus heckerae]|nr:MAG: rRNA maturation RNase YbeY [Cycloclasticus sp. symbiont of Bathymodiolus heckerae]